jgi:benzodiazapine receptor
MIKSLSLLLFVLLSFSAGWFGSQFKPGAWYNSLAKPIWTPPALAFPIAWTILYALMGTSAWLVWQKRADKEIGWALSAFLLQLIFNAAWSWIFFGRHAIGAALLEIAALWMLIAVTMVLSWRISPAAGWFLAPYLLWVSFAVALNGAIWFRNSP